MMTESDIAQVQAAIAEGWTLMAGDPVTHVTAAGQETNLLTIKYDVPTGDKQAEGLEIDNAGMLLGDAQNLCFLTSYLDAMDVTLEETDHWLINEERWDYAMDAPIQRALVPIAGIHSLIMVTIRKAAELNSASPKTGNFTFE